MTKFNKTVLSLMAILVLAIPVVVGASDYIEGGNYQGYVGYHRFHRNHHMNGNREMRYRDCCYYLENQERFDEYQEEIYNNPENPEYQEDTGMEELPRTNDGMNNHRRGHGGQYSEYYRHHRNHVTR